MKTVKFPIEWIVLAETSQWGESGELVCFNAYEMRLMAPFVPHVGMEIICPDSGEEMKINKVALCLASDPPWCAVDVSASDGQPWCEASFSGLPSWKVLSSDSDD